MDYQDTALKQEFFASIFWDWSLYIYEQPNVSKTLISLQEKGGLNINLILWCCWIIERNGEAPSDSLIKTASDKISPITKTVTSPLREARRNIKKLSSEILITDAQSAIKSAEIITEKLEQSILSSLVMSLPSLQLPLSNKAKKSTAYDALNRYALLCNAHEKNEFSNILIKRTVNAIYSPKNI